MANQSNIVLNFIGKFTVLKGAARELWLTLGIKLVNYAAYKVTNLTLVLWLSSDFGFSDKQALGMVAAWSLSMTIVTLLVGSLTDVIGLRKTFLIGAGICLVARAVMIVAPTPWIAIVFGLFPLAVGEALGTPVLVAAVRKYSSIKQRSIAFSFAYSLLNAGSYLAARLFDFLRKVYGEYGGTTIPLLGLKLSTYQTLFLVSFFIELLLFPLILGLRKGAEVADDGVVTVRAEGKPAGGLAWHRAWEGVRTSFVSTGQLLAKLVRQPMFFRLIVFLLLIAFLKLIFMQMDYVFPKFGIRELGEGAPVGNLWGINSLIVFFLAPIVGALTQRYSAYSMVTVGAILSAASVFIMALPTVWFQPLADSPFGQWFGHSYLGLTGAIHPYYVMILIYVVILSFGEAFYSPRVYEYASAIAPKGQEASYAALSYVPFLLAKLLIGIVFGPLLAKYCPATGERHSEIMWLFIALFATVAPVGLIALRRFIRVREAGREK